MKLLPIVLISALLFGCAGEPEQSPARIETLELTDETFGRTRTLRVWLPPGYDGSEIAYPVLYLFDGQNLFDAALSLISGAEWEVDETAIRLIAEGAIEPIIIVGVDNAGDPGRAEEYLPYPEPAVELSAENAGARRLPAFFQNDVFPIIDAAYRTSDDRRGLGGSSFGGIATLTMAIETPDLFDRLLVESPSLWVAEEQMLTDIATADLGDDKIFVGMGGRESSGSCDQDPEDYDGVAVAQVERLDKILQDKLSVDQFRVMIDECAAHTESAWAKRLPGALTFLYGAD